MFDRKHRHKTYYLGVSKIIGGPIFVKKIFWKFTTLHIQLVKYSKQFICVNVFVLVKLTCLITYYADISSMRLWSHTLSMTTLKCD